MNAEPLQPLDPFAVPLAGIRVVEASAGTGKTHTITNLYARLLLESGRRVDEVLVLTFTTAATAELRDKLRRKLVTIAAALEREAGGESSQNPPGDQDEFCTWFLRSGHDRAPARRQVEAALRSFDEAAIFTIHGFCQRLLGEFAFLSGAAFEAELIGEERDLISAVARDFWRREVCPAGTLWLEFLIANKAGDPDALAAPLAAHLGRPFLEVRGGEVPADCAARERHYLDACARAKVLWKNAGLEITELLTQSDALKRNSYKEDSIAKWAAAMDQACAGDAAAWGLPDCLDKFTHAGIAAGTKKGKTSPDHAFFARADELAAAREALSSCYAQRLLGLRRQFIEGCNRELAVRKAQQRLQSYNDLLNSLLAALQAEHGAALAQAVRNRYTAVLVDEFQDTDPVQYGIFRRIYHDTGAPVFLVGDPKQAIYGFRGADVFAYLEARRDAAASNTLTVNWRSLPGLIDAVNAVFSQAPDSFLLPAIGFRAATPAKKQREALAVGSDAPAPFRLWLIDRDEGGRLISKQDASRRVAAATAAEIARLLSLGARGEARLGSEPLQGGHVAVLVRKHSQAVLVKEALARLGVHSIELSEQSVLTTREAVELERVLRAVAEPGDDTCVRTALITDMLGVSGGTLCALGRDDAAWEACVERFQDYHRLWRERGFYAMLRRLLEREGVTGRLLQFRDGERRLTNLLHLAELIQAQAARTQAGPKRLLEWYCRHRRIPAHGAEEAQLRLESDERLVRIITIHRSKGLEFPIVFCPFPWDVNLDTRKGYEPRLFHDPDKAFAPVLQLDAGDTTAAAQARCEARAEDLRLLYVALTRARHRCYMVWGAASGAQWSAPAWLLHRPEAAAADRSPPADAVAQRFEALTAEQLRADLARLEQAADGAILIESLPAAAAGPFRGDEAPAVPAAPRRFAGTIPAPWRLASYSSLIRSAHEDQPDYDAGAAAPIPPQGPAQGIHAFPRGARAGRCIHAIFEALDFTQSDAEVVRRVIAQQLDRFDLGAEWLEVLAANVNEVLNAKLTHDTGLRLRGVSRDRRLDELEFYYPLAPLGGERLRTLLAGRAGVPGLSPSLRLDGLDFDIERGYMKGYIDLVFEADGRYFIVDYKSNWLGDRTDAYAEAELTAAMVREAYVLQYLIYILAVHRHLRRRLPGYDYGRHFGGVLYLFVRGIEAARGPAFGIFRDRPDAGLIDALDRSITGAAVGTVQ